MNETQALQDKAVGIINFRADNNNVGKLYKNNRILRISDYIKLLNCLIVRYVLTNSSIPPFQNYFIKSENLRQYNTRHAKQNSCHTDPTEYWFLRHKVNTAQGSDNME